MKSVIMALATLVVLFSGAAQAATDLSAFDHIDPKHEVPDVPLRTAATYLKDHSAEFKNQNYMVVVDYTQRATDKRMYVIDLHSGEVERHLVANGQGSDTNRDGIADRFSNSGNTHESSLGFFRTGEIYTGKHGKSLRLDGLSATNKSARARAIVVHAAKYVNEDTDHVGRSWGCLAVDPDISLELITKIKGGALIYSYGK